MKLKSTNHSYYCNDANYSLKEAYCELETWDDFKNSWLNDDLEIDHDYNHCFRFDINPHYDDGSYEEIEGRYSLHLYMMLQRKGHFIPITIKEIVEDDMPEIKKYLNSCWKYLKGQWVELDSENGE